MIRKERPRVSRLLWAQRASSFTRLIERSFRLLIRFLFSSENHFSGLPLISKFVQLSGIEGRK
jgi:hypothetical protein